MNQAFFAIVWKEGASETRDLVLSIQLQLERKPSACITSQSGLRSVLYDLSPDDCTRNILPVRSETEARSGAIFGTLFKTGSGRRMGQEVGKDDARRFHHSQGRSILTDFWGTYAAFSGQAYGIHIIADPSGAMPVYYTEQQGAVLIFSHLEACTFIDRGRFTVDRDFISQLLVYDRKYSTRTGLKEVSRLLAGQCLSVSCTGLHHEQVWDPRQIATCRDEPPLPDAANALRETSRHCVRAWSASSTDVLVSLSGGLDSAIVLSCLSPRSVGAVHHNLEGSDRPEINYARSAAQFSGCHLEEVHVAAARTLPDMDQHPLSPLPWRQFLEPDPGTLLGPYGRRHGQDLFTGQGGDHLFLTSKSMQGFTDYLIRNGAGQSTFQELLNSARLSGQSVWQVFGSLIARGRRPQTGTGRQARQFPVPGLQAEIQSDASPVPVWMTSQQHCPPGKFVQITRLAHMYQLHDPLCHKSGTMIVHPLISQPLIELCLRLPVYTLCTGGISRGLARHAFKGDIPEDIRTRMTKGYASAYFAGLISHNREKLLAVLPDGALAAAGLIRGPELAAYIRGERYRIDRRGSRLLALYPIEAWLRRWQGAGAH